MNASQTPCFPAVSPEKGQTCGMRQCRLGRPGGRPSTRSVWGSMQGCCMRWPRELHGSCAPESCSEVRGGGCVQWVGAPNRARAAAAVLPSSSARTLVRLSPRAPTPPPARTVVLLMSRKLSTPKGRTVQRLSGVARAPPDTLAVSGGSAPSSPPGEGVDDPDESWEAIGAPRMQEDHMSRRYLVRSAWERAQMARAGRAGRPGH